MKTGTFAKLLGVTPRTVQRRALAGYLPFLKTQGGQLIFNDEFVEKVAKGETTWHEKSVKSPGLISGTEFTTRSGMTRTLAARIASACARAKLARLKPPSQCS